MASTEMEEVVVYRQDSRVLVQNGPNCQEGSSKIFSPSGSRICDFKFILFREALMFIQILLRAEHDRRIFGRLTMLICISFSHAP
jgi:hypothetical protein